MKTKAEVIAALLQGSQDQPPGKFVNVLAEDIVLALTPEPAPTPVNDDPDPSDQ